MEIIDDRILNVLTEQLLDPDAITQLVEDVKARLAEQPQQRPEQT